MRGAAGGLRPGFAVLLAALVAGCGGGPTTIGPAGGTVPGPGGSQVVIPAGALAAPVGIQIATGAAGAPVFAVTGATALGPVYALTPHGTAFGTPATLTIPFDAALVPGGQVAQLFKAEPGGSFAPIPATVVGTALVAQVTGFSYVLPAALPFRLNASLLVAHCVREALTGLVWCWGDQGAIADGSGQVAPGSSNTAVFPEPVRLPARSFSEVIAGAGWVCGITNGAEVWCIGDTVITSASGLATVPDRTWVQIPLPAGVVLHRLSGGGYDACGIGSPASPDQGARGRVFCWGDNVYGQLGRGPASPTSQGVAAVANDTVYAHVAVGGGFVCASQEFSGAQIGGTVDCWGSNVYSELSASQGLTRSNVPIARGVVVATRPGALSAGGSVGCGVQNDGTALCWGDNFEGQRGDGTAGTGLSGQNFYPPAPVQGPHIWRTVVAAGRTTCGLDTAGASFCWGSSVDGSLGSGQASVPGGKQLTPVAVAGPVQFVELSSELCGRTSEGDVYCWGTNRFYDLGLGQDAPATSASPVQVKASGLARALP